MSSAPAVIAKATITAFLDELELDPMDGQARREAMLDLIELAAAVAATHGASADEVEKAAVEGHRHGAATMAAS